MLGEFSEKAHDIFYDALRLHPSERDAFLAQACGEDERLRTEVESLLQSAVSGEDLNRTELADVRIPADASLQPGDVLNCRFRIARFIASGGMGSVYEAEDLALREHVALKTIRSDLVTDPRTTERFKREIQLARKVTHPNVCRIFDFAEDRASPRGQVAFLTMELLPGETLGNRIRRTGPISTEEALPIVRQMCAALAAAHEAGVVHRDFKSGNVMLAPAGSGTRAVVTDFGLAYASRSEHQPLQSLSQTGAVTGTPLYMAPEQIRGQVTPAVDIYALGVVMFEMVTQTWPFSAANTFEIIEKKITQNAPSPRAHAANLDPRWEKAILRCLERDPQDRFASVMEVVDFLEGQKVAAPKRRLRRRMAVSAGILGLVLAAVCAHLLLPKPTPSRRSIAVLGFENVTGRPEVNWISTDLAVGLREQLAVSGKLRTVSGEDVADYEKDIGIHNFDSLGKQTLHRLHGLGADLVVVGSYTDRGQDSGNRIHLNIEIQDTGRGETIDALSADGTERDISDLVAQTGTRLRDKLGIGAISPEKIAQLSATQANAEAAPFYSDGLDKLRSYDLPAAQELFEKAIMADPTYAYAHAALAETLYQLGFDEKAREEAKKAVDESLNFPLEDKLSIQGRYAAIAAEWPAAVEKYGELHKYYPDNLDYGLNLAEAQSFGGKAADALNTLADLTKLVPPQGDDPRIDLQRAETAASVGDQKTARTSATLAIRKAKTREMKVLQLRALNWACEAFEHLGDAKQAKTLCHEEAELSSTLGDKVGSARAVNGLASIDSDQGDIQEALTLYEQAFQIAAGIGDRRDMAGALNNLALILSAVGRLPEARQKFEQALTIEREINNLTEESKTLGNLAMIAGHMGDVETEQREYEKSIELARQTGDREDLARGLTNLGEVLVDLGQLSRAASNYDEALSLRRQMGVKRDIAITLDSIGDLRLAKGDLQGAASSYRQALEMQQEVGDKSWAATSQQGLASVLIEQEDFKNAEMLARKSLQEFQAESDGEDQTLSRLILARSLMGQKQFSAAEKEVNAAGQAKVSPALQTNITIVRSRLAAEGDDRMAMRSAVTGLHEAIALAAKSKMLGQEFEARLALAEVTFKLGQTSSARALIAKLSQQASQSGFALIARKAQAIEPRS